MKLVMVHGRGQAGKEPAAIQKEWTDALMTGLDRAGRSLPAGTTIELPYYADELDRLVEETKTPLGKNVLQKGVDGDVQEELRGEILKEVAEQLGVSDAEISREFGGPATEKGPQNWEWVQSILKAIDKIPGVNSEVIDLITRDVYVYLSFPGVRRVIDKIVIDALGNEPCVVLSHSLGTVVAYNVLYKRAAAPPCPRFVTVGSPLGISAIKRSIETPLKTPPPVGSWFNAYDERDVVALRPLDSKNFDVNPAIVNKSDVRNFTENRHGIAGYLSDPVVASRVVELL